MGEGLDPRDDAEALLVAARIGDRDRFAKQLGALAKDIESHVRLVTRKNGRLLSRVPALSEDDVVQEVFQRLMRAPPTGEADNPLALVLAWAGTTTMRFLLDEATRPSSTRRQVSFEAERDRGEANSPLERIERPDVDHRREENPSRRVEARSELVHVKNVLAARYPRGLELLEAEISHPDETDDVLARTLRTSVANIQQIRHRRIRILVADVSAPGQDGRP